MFETPILLILFNRPEHTRRVVDRLRAIKPKYLFVAADGPRRHHPLDEVKCTEAREVMRSVDWTCELKTLYRDRNLGCDKGPAEAITWFFDHVDAGIILEDDCLPAVSFFPFCSELLFRYAAETRVMMISGFNPLGTWYENDIDYFFSEGSIWGWATWKRAWSRFDLKLEKYASAKHRAYLNDLIEYLHPSFTEAYQKILNGSLDAWDYQWHFARLINNALSITPSRNLIENIGFGESATHTKWELHPFKGIKTHEMKFPLRHNDLMILDRAFAEAAAERERKDPSFFKKSWHSINKRLTPQKLPAKKR